MPSMNDLPEADTTDFEIRQSWSSWPEERRLTEMRFQIWRECPLENWSTRKSHTVPVGSLKMEWKCIEAIDLSKQINNLETDVAI